ncbi:MAG: Holliday junction branch migration DNA helicase RuvB [Chloroflexota bacterium]|nr:Holliday junction branch migration DNA helicase RuvB [Chloroflexota bacterium]MDE2687143.1 Holliday junction branch migration DNA helicase RuvB [Chloroflexota bacterium]
MNERIVSGAPHEFDHSLDSSLRPRRIADYIGQNAVKNLLVISVKAAQQRGEPLDHVLLYGPPGLGKTTLANIMAFEMGAQIKTTSGPAIERPGDMVATLTQMQEGDILFIDEIHRLSRVVEEVLYPAMEDYFVSWVIDKGLKARSMNLSIKPFTLIGATTRYGMLSPPLRDRFGNIHRLDFYDEDAMATIVGRSARILEIDAEEQGVVEIASRARGTPRIANRLLRRVRDYAQVIGDGVITADIAREALSQLEVDGRGLDGTDTRMLRSIIEKFDGGPVGLDTIAASISEDSDTIEDVYEPYLLQLGFLDKTPRGRIATRLAYDHLGFNYGKDEPNSAQASLF